jgi:hypothetical protein
MVVAAVRDRLYSLLPAYSVAAESSHYSLHSTRYCLPFVALAVEAAQILQKLWKFQYHSSAD